MTCSRVNQMKRYLDEHAAEIERWEFGHVRFDWSKGDVKIDIGRSERIGKGESSAPPPD